jgi:hypothetical protein
MKIENEREVLKLLQVWMEVRIALINGETSTTIVDLSNAENALCKWSLYNNNPNDVWGNI